MFEFKQRWNDDRASKRKQAEQSRQSVVEAEAAVATTNRFKWKHVNTRKHAHYTYSRSLGRSVSSIRAHTYAQEWADVRALAPKNTHTCTHMYTHTPPIEWLRIYRNYFMCFSLYFISECSYSLSLSPTLPWPSRSYFFTLFVHQFCQMCRKWAAYTRSNKWPKKNYTQCIYLYLHSASV